MIQNILLASLVWLLSSSFLSSDKLLASGYSIVLDKPSQNELSFKRLSTEVAARTSMSLHQSVKQAQNIYRHPWLWTEQNEFSSFLKAYKVDLGEWLKRGGFFVIQGVTNPQAVQEQLGSTVLKSRLARGKWTAIPVDHSLLRSFYLLKSLPTCVPEHSWYGYQQDGRLTILLSPLNLLKGVSDRPIQSSCLNKIGMETLTRLMINISMVAMTTDYKSDQIHLPEILKRLR